MPQESTRRLTLAVAILAVLVGILGGMNVSLVVRGRVTRTLVITITKTYISTKTLTYTTIVGPIPHAAELNLTQPKPYVIQYVPSVRVLGYWNSTIMFDGEPDHVYRVPAYTGFFLVNVSWGIVVPATIYGDLLIVTTSGPFNMTFGGFPYYAGSVVALNISNGEPVWFDTFPNQIMTQPIVVNGVLYVGLGNAFMTSEYRGTGINEIVAINVSDGRVLWNYTTLGEDMPTPTYYNGLLIEADGGDEAFALNATNGQLAWEVPIEYYDSMSSMLLVNGVVYFGASAAFYAINASNGNVIWADYLINQYPNMGGLDDSSPAYYNGIVVTSFTIHNSSNIMYVILAAFNATNGNILWILNEGPAPVPKFLEAPPVTIYDGVVLHDSPTGYLYAVNVSNGEVLWRFRIGFSLSNPDAYGCFIIAVNRTGALYTLLLNGTLVKVSQIPVLAGPGDILVTNNSVIVVGINGVVDSIPLHLVVPLRVASCSW